MVEVFTDLEDIVESGPFRHELPTRRVPWPATLNRFGGPSDFCAKRSTPTLDLDQGPMPSSRVEWPQESLQIQPSARPRHRPFRIIPAGCGIQRDRCSRGRVIPIGTGHRPRRHSRLHAHDDHGFRTAEFLSTSWNRGQRSDRRCPDGGRRGNGSHAFAQRRNGREEAQKSTKRLVFAVCGGLRLCAKCRAGVQRSRPEMDHCRSFRYSARISGTHESRNCMKRFSEPSVLS